jgi:dipeptidyl aminopeptidase/acylaminoacyl peptidase
MRNIAVLLTVLAAACATHAAPEASGTGRLSIEQLIDIRHPSNPTWSPDGRSIVFVWDRAGVSKVYVADAAGGRPPRGLPGAGSTLAGAFWSHDGRALLLPKDGDLWRLPLDGGAASAVWTTPRIESSIVPSPDGTRVAFVRSLASAFSDGSSSSVSSTSSKSSSPFSSASSSGGSFESPARGGRSARANAQGANAGSELLVRSLADGREWRVARSDDLAIAAVGWSPDGEHLVYTAGAHTIRHEQTPPYSGAKIIYTVSENVPGQTFVVAAGGGSPTLLDAGGGGLGGPGGRRWLDARHFLSERTSPDYKRRTTLAVDLAGGHAAVLREEDEARFWSMTGDANAGAQPSPDGKWIAFLSDRDGWDHLYLMPAPGQSGAGAVVAVPRRADASSAALADNVPSVQITKGKFEAWRPQWSPDGTRVAFDANEPDHYGDRHLYVATVAGNPARATIAAITTGRGTDIAPQWSPDGTRLVYQHTDPHNSADLWVVEVGKAGVAAHPGTPVRLTDSMPASMDRASFVEPEMVHYAGPDGQQVPAWMFVPKNLDRSRKHPAIVWIHGDGVNQNYDGWHVQRNYAVYYSFHQYLLQQGYVVIAPDYRGSIGYGRAWREGVYMDVGGNDAKDAWMAANYLKTLPFVDTGRIGVWGLSYGGFFTLIAVTDQPQLFRAAVDVAGVVDYAMYYEDPYHGSWTASRIGTPHEHPDVYARASPLSHVDRLERPLLVLHGTSDVNVPYLHSVRLIDELMKHGKGELVSFMTYPGEFHYFTREHVLRDAWHRVEAFFDAQLAPRSVTSH